ncbi:hypothetical protein BC828DRAFT_406713 [Blastocladiella britannica]|nr:hypothetical protein BC828DRAFT_406713 [Blastocladiella britannica]
MATVARVTTGIYLVTSIAAIAELHRAALALAPAPATTSSADGLSAPPPPSPPESRVLRLLALDPVHAPLAAWTYLTYPAPETIVWRLTVTVPALFYSLRYFERHWGARGLLRFLFASAGTTSALVMVWYLLVLRLWWPVGDDTRIHGAIGLAASGIVAYKQCVPEHVVKFGIGSGFRVKHLPFAWLIGNAVTFALLGATYLPYYALSLAGFLAAWWYLRFVRFEDAIRGDRSESFAFASFFPDRIQPWIRPVTDRIFQLAVRLKLVSAAPTRILDMDPRRRSGFVRLAPARRFLASATKPVAVATPPLTPSTGSSSASAAGISDSDRRKATALRALEERLKQPPH